MVKFFLSMVLAAGIVGGITWYGAADGHFSIPSFFAETLIFLVFSTGLLFLYLYRAETPDFFLRLYLLTLAVKLLAYCAYMLFVILEDRTGAIENVVFFMATYFVFTALEIGFLYRKITGENKP